MTGPRASDDHLDDTGSGGGPRRRYVHPGIQANASKRTIGIVTALILVLMAGGALTAVLTKDSNAQVNQQTLSKDSVTVTGGQSNHLISASNAALMGLEKLPGKTAPDFTLTDQNGHSVELSKLLAHHAVVLTFMDDRCLDICPIVAQELIDAYHRLGPLAPKVDFVAVNLNVAHRATRWLRAFISEHGLNALPSFYYLTGNPSALRSVWSRYGVAVKVSQTGKVFHSEAMYFISSGGTMRYAATPFANMRKNGTGWLPAATKAQWSDGIAQYAKAVAP